MPEPMADMQQLQMHHKVTLSAFFKPEGVSKSEQSLSKSYAQVGMK